MVVPPVVTGYVLLIALGRHGQWAGLVFTWWGAAIAQAIIALPLMVLTLRIAIESVDPELEIAAAQMGASPFNIFRHVTLPLSWHGLAAGCVLGFARAIGEFGATIVVAGNIAGQTRTLPLAIYTTLNTPPAPLPPPLSFGVTDAQSSPDLTILGLTLIAIAIALAALILSRHLTGRALRWRW